ncbi:hypothetical protein [Spirillospora sp. NPDC047279]|uniref:hypothetical protein n=1 Tax=Spirillospora sp. NPDC047279 TaxID=3155478 RepID=UPI0033C44D71
MTKTPMIALALGLALGAAACDGDGDTKSASPAPSASTAAPAAPGTPSSPAAAPTTPAARPPAASPSWPSAPKISNSREIVMIDPDGKRYTFRTMVQMAAGMRATMGNNAPKNFCAASYRQGVDEGGKFPAGRSAFMAACAEGWEKGARPR